MTENSPPLPGTSRASMVAMLTIAVSVVVYVWFCGSMRARLEGPGPEVHARGVAEVTSCSTPWLRFGLTKYCDATVQWDVGLPGAAPERVTIFSVTDLHGRVEVFDRGSTWSSRGRTRTDRAVVPVNYPAWVDTDKYVLPAVLVGLVFAAVTGFVGYRLGRLLPARRPKPEKVTKNWRGVDRSGVPKFNGPRRRKRKRG